jgi:hypothetical protein
MSLLKFLKNLWELSRESSKGNFNNVVKMKNTYYNQYLISMQMMQHMCQNRGFFYNTKGSRII